MESNWAVEHLQVIRTLMERSAVYRRALAPIMLLLGALGVLATIVGSTLPSSPRGFVCYWLAIALAAISGAFLMARRQALKEHEAFWSPPTRRVAQAALPAFAVGMIMGAIAAFSSHSESTEVRWLPPVWMALYGCAIHSAGFFMPRGMKLFAWIFIGAGFVSAVFIALSPSTPLSYAHALMGLSFGGLHLAYGIYLYFTEKRKNAA